MAKPQFTRLKFDLDKLNDPLIAEQFKATLGGKFAPLLLFDENSNIDDNVQTFEKATIETATDILGKKTNKKKPWITSEVLNMCDKRRALKEKKMKDPEVRKEYSKSNKEVKREIIKAKEKWITEQCDNIEKSLKTYNSKKAYETVKELTKPKQSKVTSIKDKNGEVIIEKNKILERWTEYCSELYNYKSNGHPSVLSTDSTNNDDKDDIILKSESLSLMQIHLTPGSRKLCIGPKPRHKGQKPKSHSYRSFKAILTDLIT